MGERVGPTFLSYFLSAIPSPFAVSTNADSIASSDPALLSPLLTSQPAGVEKGGVLSIGRADRAISKPNGWNVFRRYGSTDDEEK